MKLLVRQCVVFALITLGATGSAFAQCANIEGKWSSPGPNGFVSEDIRQTGCDFLANLPAPYFNHAVSGKFLGNSNYSLTIARSR